MHELSPRRFNTRLGVALFVVYLVLYLGFVLTNAFAADLMEVTVMGGLNLAILYGFGLILAALLLALIYGVMCRSEGEPSAGQGGAASTAGDRSGGSHAEAGR